MTIERLQLYVGVHLSLCLMVCFLAVTLLTKINIENEIQMSPFDISSY